MAKKKVPPQKKTPAKKKSPLKKSVKKAAAKKPPAKKATKRATKKAVAKKAAVKRPVAMMAAEAVPCVTAPVAQQVVDGCMARFGVAGLSKQTNIGQALQGRVPNFCSCIRTSSGVANAACNAGMSFLQVEIGLVC